MSEDGVGALLGRSAASQQYKQAAVLYTLLASRLRPKPMSASLPSDMVTVAPDQLANEAEALLGSCGEKVISPQGITASAMPSALILPLKQLGSPSLRNRRGDHFAASLSC